MKATNNEISTKQMLKKEKKAESLRHFQNISRKYLGRWVWSQSGQVKRLKNDWISDVLWTKDEVRIFKPFKTSYLCVHLHLWVWRPEHNPWEVLVPSLPANWTQAIRLSCKDYSSSWAILLAPILFFYFQTWSTMWTWWHTPQSQPLGRQRQEDSFESKDLRQVWVVT